MWAAIRPWLFPVWCAGCGASGSGLCPACSTTAHPAAIVLDDLAIDAAGDYEGALREAILGLKRGERAYLDPLAALVAPLVAPGTILVPAPTSRRRAAERGFDQARELAQRVARLRSGTVTDVLLKRGGAQHGRGRTERLTAHGRFALRPGVALPPRVLLLDDVLTTGATLHDAAATLAAAGCRVDGAVVVARTPAVRET